MATSALTAYQADQDDQRAHPASRIETAARPPRSWSINHAPARISQSKSSGAPCPRLPPGSSGTNVRATTSATSAASNVVFQRSTRGVSTGGSDFRFDLSAGLLAMRSPFPPRGRFEDRNRGEHAGHHRQHHRRPERVHLMQQQRAEAASGRSADRSSTRPVSARDRTRSAGARSDSCRLRTGCGPAASGSTPPRACRKSERPARTAARTPRVAARPRRRTWPSAWPWRSQKPTK